MHGKAHYPVLLKESTDALLINLDGIYLDGTFGRGGHSREILNRLSSNSHLFAFDKDPEAVAIGKTLEKQDERFTMIHGSFSNMEHMVVVRKEIAQVDGIILDLGVSSPQLDNAERGFSFLKDGPLDMRMNNISGQTAEQWLRSADAAEIASVLKDYGEERYAKRIANAIVKKKQETPITRTLQLANIVSAANPSWEKGKHPATRVFQAIRIYINRELEDLETALVSALKLLKVGGRLVVISFHSLEDRIVKRFFREKSRGKEIPISIPVTDNMLSRELKLVGRVTRANKAEVYENHRSRSAVMRVAEKI